MKTPTTPFTALALALVLAGAANAQPNPDLGRAADGRVIVPDDFVGPLQPNQVYKSESGSPDPAAVNALKDIGEQQMAENGIPSPDIVASNG